MLLVLYALQCKGRFFCEELNFWSCTTFNDAKSCFSISLQLFYFELTKEWKIKIHVVFLHLRPTLLKTPPHKISISVWQVITKIKHLIIIHTSIIEKKNLDLGAKKLVCISFSHETWLRLLTWQNPAELDNCDWLLIALQKGRNQTLFIREEQQKKNWC